MLYALHSKRNQSVGSLHGFAFLHLLGIEEFCPVIQQGVHGSSDVLYFIEFPRSGQLRLPDAGQFQYCMAVGQRLPALAQHRPRACSSM